MVLVVIAAMTVPAALLSSMQAPVYRATAELVLGQQRLDNDFNIEATDLSDRQIATQTRVITGNQVTELALEQGARGSVEVQTPSLSNVLTVSAQDTDPQQAAVTANAYVQAYIDYRTEQVRTTLDEAAEQLQQRITLLQQEIDPLSQQVRESPPEERPAVQALIQPLQSGLQEQQASLQAQLGQLQVQRALAASGASLVQRAEPPQSPISPRPARDSALAATLAVALGISLAILVETMAMNPRSSAPPTAPSAPLAPSHLQPGGSRGSPRSGWWPVRRRKPSPTARAQRAAPVSGSGDGRHPGKAELQVSSSRPSAGPASSVPIREPDRPS